MQYVQAAFFARLTFADNSLFIISTEQSPTQLRIESSAWVSRFCGPIVRGKACKLVEFGAKLNISVVNGWGPDWMEYCSLTPTMRRPGIYRRWWSTSGYGRDIIPTGFWRTKSIETGKRPAVLQRARHPALRPRAGQTKEW